MKKANIENVILTDGNGNYWTGSEYVADKTQALVFDNSNQWDILSVPGFPLSETV